MLNRFIAAVAIFTACCAICANAQNRTTEKINAYLDEAHEAGLLNGNILIEDHGVVLLRRAIGFADAKRTRPLNLSDRFDIGSISKEFDAVGLLILVEQGKLSLTDPVAKFIPNMPPWAQTVTIDELLHYTSGLPDVDWNTVNSDADNLRNLRGLKQLDYPAGTHYAYNNNNTFLRRRVIEKVSGASFSKFVETYELPRAGITDAVVDPTDATPNIARAFDANYKQDPIIDPITGWTELNVDDFLRWSHCITDFCLISPDSTRHIVTTSNPHNQSGLGHGTMDGNRLISHVHDGNDRNFEALLMADPLKGRTIILVTSQEKENVYGMAEAINAILDGKPYVPLRQAKD